MPTVTPAASAAPTGPTGEDDAAAALHGWQALAVAELGRPLGRAELDAAVRLPPALALDLLFAHLTPEARHEALCALE